MPDLRPGSRLFLNTERATTNFALTLPEKEDWMNPTIGLLICKDKDNTRAIQRIAANYRRNRIGAERIGTYYFVNNQVIVITGV